MGLMHLKYVLRIAGLAAVAILLAPAFPLASAPNGAVIGPHGFDLSYLDRSCRACDDFYQFAVGKYAASHPIPDDKGGVGSFEELAERNRAELHDIVEASAYTDRPPAGSVARQVGDYYAACMDTAGSNSRACTRSKRRSR